QRGEQETDRQGWPHPVGQELPGRIFQGDGAAVHGHGGDGQDQVEEGGVEVVVVVLAGREHGGAGVEARGAIRPRSELDSAPVITTSANCPISCFGPGKLTDFMFSVFPVNSASSLRDAPVTRTRCTLPTMPLAMVAAWALIRACRRSSRACFTASGVSSSRSAAGVPGRRE